MAKIKKLKTAEGEFYYPVTVSKAVFLADGSKNVEDAIADKVDKVAGKGLSTNDYTSADKAKVSSLPDATALTNDLANKADKASPALTGTPTAPTAAAGTNTTQIATTAFVASAVEAEATARTSAIAAETTARTAAEATLTANLATEVTAREEAVNNINAAIASGVGTTTAIIQPSMTTSETSTTDGVSAKGIADFVAEQKALTDADVSELALKVEATETKDYTSTETAGYYLASKDGEAMRDSTVYYTVEIPISVGDKITSNTMVVTTSAIKNVLLDDSKNRVKFLTTAEAKDYTILQSDIDLGAKTIAIVYNTTTQTDTFWCKKTETKNVKTLVNDVSILSERIDDIETELHPISENVVFCSKVNSSVLAEMYFPNLTSEWKIAGVSIYEDYFRFTLIKPDGTSIIRGIGNNNDGYKIGKECSGKIIEFIDGDDRIGYFVLNLIDGGYAISSASGYSLNVDKITSIESSPRIKEYLSRKENVLLIGDSLFGFQGQNLLSVYLADFLNKKIYNSGFPGCRAALRTDDASSKWDKMSLVGVVDCIENNDFTDISNAIDGLSASYDYFKRRLASLKSCDFSLPTTIYINYGNNDITGSSQIGDYWTDGNTSFDKNTFLGAVNYSISKLLTKYPHIKVVYLTPSWRRLGSSVSEDGGTSGTLVPPYAYTNSIGKTFMEYKSAIETNCERCGVKVLDMFKMGGRTAFNFDEYSVDSSHYNLKGYKMLAKYIAAADNTL